MYINNNWNEEHTYIPNSSSIYIFIMFFLLIFDEILDCRIEKIFCPKIPNIGAKMLFLKFQKIFVCQNGFGPKKCSLWNNPNILINTNISEDLCPSRCEQNQKEQLLSEPNRV